LICPHCKQPVTEDHGNALEEEFGQQPEVLYHGAGCRNCSDSGYFGRLGIFEQMVISEEIRSLLVDKASAFTIRQVAMNNGMSTLRQDGYRYLLDGRTTFQELLRVTKKEHLNGSQVPT
jgi:type II secretory ATPase GspE/PulE/Tfp pilus assembly ATPase PilB-like protein